jgi:hypothetical protein
MIDSARQSGDMQFIHDVNVTKAHLYEWRQKPLELEQQKTGNP